MHLKLPSETPIKICFTLWPLGDTIVILEVYSPKTCYRLSSWALLVKLLSDECHRKLAQINQHWLRYWLGAWWHQAPTWANVVPHLCCHMVSLGHNEFRPIIQHTTWKVLYTINFKDLYVCVNILLTTLLIQITHNTTIRNQSCRLHQGPILLNNFHLLVIQMQYMCGILHLCKVSCGLHWTLAQFKPNITHLISLSVLNYGNFPS